MYRLANGTQVASLPAAPAPVGTPGYGTDGNPGAGQLASIFGAAEYNRLQEELMAFLTAAGIAPDKDDNGQVLQAVRRLFGGGLTTVSATGALAPGNAGLVLVNAAGGNVTLTLPAASALNARPIFFLLVRTDTSANTVTVQRAGADAIEGATSLVLSVGARQPLVSDGVSAWYAGADGMKPWLGSYQLFVGSGTFTATRTGWHVVDVWGAGGGGSGGSGGSGGAGGWSRKRIWLNAGDTVTVTVGSGGAGASGGASAGNGGASSFGAHCSATGGTGAGAAEGFGGSGSGGDINGTGQDGLDLGSGWAGEMARGGLPPAWLGYGHGGLARANTALGGNGGSGAVLVSF
jgi:hypothetical protein